MMAHAMKCDCERCLNAGMDGYAAKPIRVAVLFPGQVMSMIDEPATTRARPRGGRFQFRLSHLLMAVTAFALLLAWWTWPPHMVFHVTNVRQVENGDYELAWSANSAGIDQFAFVTMNQTGSWAVRDYQDFSHEKFLSGTVVIPGSQTWRKRGLDQYADGMPRDLGTESSWNRPIVLVKPGCRYHLTRARSVRLARLSIGKEPIYLWVTFDARRSP